MSKAELRKAVGIAPSTMTRLRRGEGVTLAGALVNTMTRLRQHEEVTLSVLNRICVALDVNIGDVMEFVPENEDG